MSQVVELIAAVAAASGTVGVGLKFIWNKIEARFEHVEEELEKCRTRETAHGERRGKMLAVIELFWAEINRVDPASPALKRARKLLDEVKTMATDEAAETRKDYHG